MSKRAFKAKASVPMGRTMTKGASKAKTSVPMVRRLPITKARINLGAVVKRVHLDKEYVVLEKDGIPIVGVMDIDEFEDYLELKDPKARKDIRKSTEEDRAGKSRPAHELVAAVRRESAKRGKRRSTRRRRP